MFKTRINEVQRRGEDGESIKIHYFASLMIIVSISNTIILARETRENTYMKMQEILNTPYEILHMKLGGIKGNSILYRNNTNVKLRVSTVIPTSRKS